MRSKKQIFALILALSLLLLSFASCGKKLGEPLMTHGDIEFSVNIFELYLSRMKGTLCSVDYFGTTARSDEFWDTWVDVYDRTTYNEQYTEIVLETAKSHLAALALFEEEGLTLPDSYIAEIDAEMEELVDTIGDGSKTAFNAIIGEFGVNYEILREAHVIEAKIAYLQEHLFGADGSKIGSNIINDYYKENYARFKQVFLYTYEYEYEKDTNGDLIFFKSNGRISYDIEKTPKKDADGKYVKDKNDDVVYVYEDEDGKERIAYKTSGATTKQVLDSEGNPVVRYYNDTEKKVIYEDAQKILDEAEKGNTAKFDLLVSEHSEDEDASSYPDGYYMTADMNYASPKVIETLFDMEVGEARIVESDYGYHIMMRYELQDFTEISQKDNYDDIFYSQSTGGVIFLETLKGELLSTMVEPYKTDIVVDEKLYATVDIKRAGVNFNY